MHSVFSFVKKIHYSFVTITYTIFLLHDPLALIPVFFTATLCILHVFGNGDISPSWCYFPLTVPLFTVAHQAVITLKNFMHQVIIRFMPSQRCRFLEVAEI